LRLFASIFEREVDEKLLGELAARGQEIETVLGGDPLAGIDPGDAAAVEILAVEYCRLFIGPTDHLPPVESVVLGEERFWGPSTRAVAEFYRTVGLAPREDSKIMPDHISMELDCMAMLEETDRRDQASAFAREHVLKWVPLLAKHVSERATIAFYPVWMTGLQAMMTELYDA
jgi:TorA maturation chaperone TorD